MDRGLPLGGRIVPKVASVRGCLCCQLGSLGCRLRVCLESRMFASNAFGVCTCEQGLREAAVGREKDPAVIQSSDSLG